MTQEEIVAKADRACRTPALPGETPSETRARSRQVEHEAKEVFRREMETLHGLRAGDTLLVAGKARLDYLWKVAWDNGHSEGFYSVAQWYDDLVPLLKD